MIKAHDLILLQQTCVEPVQYVSISKPFYKQQFLEFYTNIIRTNDFLSASISPRHQFLQLSSTSLALPGLAGIGGRPNVSPVTCMGRSAIA